MTSDGWQARALSWLLAVFATLAMVGAVATMSTHTPGGANREGGPADRTIPQGKTDPRTGDAAASPAPFTTGAPRVVSTEATALLRQADALHEIAGWLAALTWAVLALVAVAAVGVLALFRLAQGRAG